MRVTERWRTNCNSNPESSSHWHHSLSSLSNKVPFNLEALFDNWWWELGGLQVALFQHAKDVCWGDIKHLDAITEEDDSDFERCLGIERHIARSILKWKINVVVLRPV